MARFNEDYVENKTLILPNMLNGPFAIGDLWNCHDSSCAGANLFGNNVVSKQLLANEVQELNYNLTHVKGTRDRYNSLKVDGEVSLEFLAGLLSIGAGGTYSGNDKFSVVEEELLCTYDLVTFVVNALPGIKEAMDQKTLESILNGKIKATHVVKGEILGAKVVASIRLKHSNDSQSTNIKGSFMGKLALGKMSAKIKADLVKLDTEDESDFAINIKLDSKPVVYIQPTSIQEMFQVIERIPEQVKSTNHPIYASDCEQTKFKVYGVRIRFILVPITEYIEVNVEQLYISLKDHIMHTFTELFSFLKNIHTFRFLPKMILESEYRMSKILSDPKNKLTISIYEREAEIRKTALSLYKEAANQLRNYKIGKITPEDLLRTIVDANEHLNLPDLIIEVNSFVKEGRKELIPVNNWDKHLTKPDILIFSNDEDLEGWLFSQEKDSVKVLMYTAGEVNQLLIAELLDMSCALKDLAIHAALAVPSISSGEFKITLKTREEQIDFFEDDIKFILDIFSVLVNQGSYVKTTFFSIISQMDDIKFRSPRSTENIISIIRQLLPYKPMMMAESDVKFKDLCRSRNSKLKLVITLGAVDSAYQSLAIFRQNKKRLSIYNEIDWIVGRFGFEKSQKFTNAPLIFIFKDGQLLGQCFDHVDFLILLEFVQQLFQTDSENPEFPKILSANETNIIENSFSPPKTEFALKVFRVFIRSGDYILKNIPDLLLPNKTLDKHICTLKNFGLALRATCLHDSPDSFSTLVQFALREIFCVSENIPTDWSDVEDYMKKDLEIHDTILEAITQSKSLVVISNLSQQNEQKLSACNTLVLNFSAWNAKCLHIIRSISQGIKPSLQNLKLLESFLMKSKNDKVKLLCLLNERFCSQGDDYTEAILSKLLSLLKDYVSDGENLLHDTNMANALLIDSENAFEILDWLSVSTLDSKLFKINSLLNNFRILTDESTMEKLIRTISNPIFTTEDHEFLFGQCKKIQLLVQININSRNCVSLFLKNYCTNLTSIPSYFPQSLQAILNKIQSDSSRQHPCVFETMDEILTTFEDILDSRVIWGNFQEALRDTLQRNGLIFNTFKSANALIHWDYNTKCFTQVWGLNSIQTAYESVKHITNDLEPKLSPNALDFTFLEAVNSNSNIHTQSSIQYKNINQHASFTRLIGLTKEVILPRRYMEASNIIEKPLINTSDFLKDGYMAELVPFLLQRIKMWGVHYINQNELASLYPYLAKCPTEVTSVSPQTTPSRAGLRRANQACTSNFPEKITCNKRKLPETGALSRLDLLTCLFASCHPTVFQEIIRIISMFPVSLPFVIQNVLGRSKETKYICLAPLLRMPTYKWKQPNTETVWQNHLFQSPFKMILTVGSGQAKMIGKSSILNQLFRDRNTFACRNDPGAELGKPLTLNGAVEMVVLNEDLCSQSLWNEVALPHYTVNKDEILLLANLHGDCKTLANTLERLKLFISSVVVFVLPMESQTFEDFVNFVENMFKDVSFAEAVFYIFVDASDEILQRYPENVHIKTQVLTQDSTLRNVRNTLRDAVEIANYRKTPCIKTLPNEVDTSVIDFAMELETQESNHFLALLSSKSCRDIKATLKLQQLGSRSSQRLFQDTIECEEWKMIMMSFTNILSIPEMDRIVAITHIEREIAQQFALQSHTIREQIMNLNQKLQKAVDVQGHSNIAEEKIREKINQTYDELNEMTLGLEHFYRELAKTYSICVAQNNKELGLQHKIKSLPENVAELLINGHAIEVLDGDALEIRTSWFNSVCHSICVRYPGLKIFVLSIIGLQSSGKSTLLNALFSCKFAVSVGRCTRGLFMRMVFLEKPLAKDIGVDVIIILDTEGLGAPEKLNDPQAEYKDRQLATFTMSVSNLTLINVLGESLADLSDIIQIVVVAMARLEKAEVSPDILMIQHVQETDASKCAAAANAFCKAIQTAIVTAEKSGMELGVRNCKSLERLQARIKSLGILKQFPSFKHGAAVSSPPSTQYHDSVISLYESIIIACKQNKHPQKFHLWHEMIGSIWEAVSNQDFALRFKNIRDIQDFIERGKIIAKVKEAIDDSIHSHKMEAESIIRNLLLVKQNADENIVMFDQKEIENIICSEIPIEPAACRKCEPCRIAEEKKEDLFELVKYKSIEEETKRTISKYVEMNRQKAVADFIQLTETHLMKRCMSADIDSIIQELLLPKINELGHTDVEIHHLTNTIWNGVVSSVSAKVKVPPVRTLIYDEVMHHYQHNDKVKQSFYKNVYTQVDLKASEGIDAPSSKQKLNANHARRLEVEIKTLPHSLLQTKRADRFLNGMVNNFKESINTFIVKFEAQFLANENKKFTPEFKSEIHLFALHQFTLVMEDKQRERDVDNHPIVYLMSKEQEYKKEISTRVRHGFTFQGEGCIIGEKLCESIRKRGEKSGDEQHLAHMRNTSWLLSYENIMLEFYLNIQEDVIAERKDKAVEFFHRPTETIETWFGFKTRSISDEKGKHMCATTIKSEFEIVQRNIRNSTSCQAILEFAQTYITLVKGVDYKYMCDTPPENASQQQFEVMKKAIEETLNSNRKELFKYSQLSEFPLKEIRKRLGCTASCPICGAICLGESNHDQDTGKTKLHHTCHQPSGLCGSCTLGSLNLLPDTCSEFTSNSKLHWPNCKEGMKWCHAVNHSDYKHWIFTTHNKSQFLNLMKWFFLQLHLDLAKKYDLNPCAKKDLKAYGYDQLPLIDEIVADLKVIVGFK